MLGKFNEVIGNDENQCLVTHKCYQQWTHVLRRTKESEKTNCGSIILEKYIVKEK